MLIDKHKPIVSLKKMATGIGSTIKYLIFLEENEISTNTTCEEFHADVIGYCLVAGIRFCSGGYGQYMDLFNRATFSNPSSRWIISVMVMQIATASELSWGVDWVTFRIQPRQRSR